MANTQQTKLVFEFANHWMAAHEQGFATSDCTFHAMQLTNVSPCVPAHREILRRAIELVSQAGIVIN